MAGCKRSLPTSTVQDSHTAPLNSVRTSLGAPIPAVGHDTLLLGGCGLAPSANLLI